MNRRRPATTRRDVQVSRWAIVATACIVGAVLIVDPGGAQPSSGERPDAAAPAPPSMLTMRATPDDGGGERTFRGVVAAQPVGPSAAGSTVIAASESIPCTLEVYDNTVASGFFFPPGPDEEALDFGTSPGGTVCRFSFGYNTDLSDPGTITIRFYSGTTGSTCPGSFLAGWTFSNLPGFPGAVIDFDIPAGEEFNLPAGAFGYSYTMSADDTGPRITSGGAGNENLVYVDCVPGTFGGSPWAGLHMRVQIQDPTPPEIRVEPASLDLGCPGPEAAAMAAKAQPVTQGDEPAPAPGDKLTDPDNRIATAFNAGQARVEVIVNLAPPRELIAATNFQDHRSRGVLQREVSRRQQAVLNALPAGDVEVRYRYENFAAFSGSVTQGALNQLLADPRVESIQPVREVEAHLAQGLPLMNALATRDTYDGAGMSVAIVDTGIDYTHPRLGGGGFPNSKVIGGFDFGDNNADPMDCHGHGTSVAGLAAGDLGTVGDYIGGVAPAAKLYALKISPGCTGSATDAAIAAAWDWSVTHKDDDPANPIMVINTSFGGDRFFGPCDGASPAVTAAANNAVAAGITVLSSSGNDGFCDSIGIPACISNVISVGSVHDSAFGTVNFCVSSNSCAPLGGGCGGGRRFAQDVTAADKVAVYSNTASFLDVLAPAHLASTPTLSGGYNTSFGGTSAASPYAAGAVAALQHASYDQTGVFLTPNEVRATLTGTGDPVTDTKIAITTPRVNLGNAIADLCQGQILTIHNDGSLLLAVADIDAPEWIVLHPEPPYSISGGDLQRVCVSFDAEACDSPGLSGTLSIHSNDPVTPTLHVGFTADCPATAPTAALVDGIIPCGGAPGTLDLSVEGGSGDLVRWLTGGCDGTEVGTGNPLMIPAPATATTYYARWENDCGPSACASVLVPLEADLDGDGDVTLDDFALLAACGTGPEIPYDPNNLPPGCPLVPDQHGIIAADINRDGVVDQLDFAILQRCYDE